ncbi:MAG: hypothetical protein KA170_19295, partial [Candidatus Promineofilum sp.]|nr:hypothetical protein [Promineifilum sp.]
MTSDQLGDFPYTHHEQEFAENIRAYDPAQPRAPVVLPPGYRLSDLATFTDAAAYCQLERVAFNN